MNTSVALERPALASVTVPRSHVAPASHVTPAAPAADRAPADLERQLEAHRKELTGYCYRMLGSGFEAEDAVQETMVRAWRAIDRFEGRSSFRSWLYRIATNVCLDMHRGPQRRARPMDLGPASTADTLIGPKTPEAVWVQPMADDRVLPEDGDPAELAAAKESVRLAFVAALQHLPAKQRAVLILREVLRWRADEVAQLLDTTVASVNSALQRARASLANGEVDADFAAGLDDDSEALVRRYVDAFERYDVNALVSLLHEEVVMSMPPFELWLRGPDQVGRWLLGQGIGCKGSRLLPIRANGCPGFGSYKPAGPGVHEPWGIQVLEIRGGRITGYNHFIDASLFPAFGLPTRLVA